MAPVERIPAAVLVVRGEPSQRIPGNADAPGACAPGATDAREGDARGGSSGLRPGSTVIFTVERNTGDGAWIAVSGGRRFPVLSSEPLLIGRSYRAVVERSSDFSLRLRIGNDPRLPAPAEVARLREFLMSSGLQADAAGLAALRAFMREGLVLDQGALGSARRLLERRGRGARQSDDEADAVARAVARGWDPNDETLDSLLCAIRPGDPRSGGRRDEQGREPDSRTGWMNSPGDGESEGGGLDRDGIETTDASTERSSSAMGTAAEEGTKERVHALARLLKFLSTRVSGAEEGQGGQTPLGLFNHAGNGDRSWIYVPYRFRLDEVAFSGCLYILVNAVSGRCDFISGNASVDRSGGTASETGNKAGSWAFSVRSAPGGRVSIVFDNRGEGSPGADVSGSPAIHAVLVRVLRMAGLEAGIAGLEPGGRSFGPIDDRV